MLHGLLRQLLQLFQQSPVVMPFASLPSPPICFQRQHTVFLQHTEERMSQSAIPDFFPAARVIVGIKLIQVFLPDHVHRRQAHGISGMPRQPVRLQQRGRSISPAGRSAALVQRRRMGTHCIRKHAPPTSFPYVNRRTERGKGIRGEVIYSYAIY